MKKIFISILIALSINCYSQITPSQLPFRVVTVSPNFPNVYPRFRTLQSTWTALKDSASVSTGKYFIINVTTSYNNISDWTSTYKDSMINRDPYMKVVAFGQAITDSIIGVTTQEFNLVAGILSLNSATAGDGLSFSGHEYMVNTGVPLYITDDTIFIHYWSQDFFISGTSLRLFKTTNSGIQETNLGIQVLPRLPMFVSGDTVAIHWYPPLYLQGGTYLGLKFNTSDFGVAGDSTFYIKEDSGMAVGSNGIYISKLPPLEFYSGVLRISPKIAGNGLNWYPSDQDSLNIQVGDGLTFDASGKIIVVKPLTQHFGFLGDGSIYLKVDSGLVAGSFPTPSTPKVSLDHQTLKYNFSGQVMIDSNVAGDGLAWSSYQLYILHNDFATIQNDTLKIRTSSVANFRFDSVTSLTAYDKNYDTIGLGMFANGYIKRVSISYKTMSGNDTVLIFTNNYAFSAKDRISVLCSVSLSKFIIYKNGSSAISFLWNNLTAPFYRHVNVAVEYWEEAQ